MRDSKVDDLCINTIRLLAVDTVEQANSAILELPWGWRP